MISGANSVHIELRNELENYIISQYFRKSPVLLEAIEGRLDEKGLLYQEPYIESSPAYKTLNNGISSANLPTWLRDFLISLADAGLGVYSSPFVHQVDALTNAFKGKDLFVSTGTGSGKTECFMWPLLSKIVTEAHENPQTWKKRGLRTIIMYPMNALVSDQIGRLRRLIGDPEDRFLEVFRKSCGYSSRRPQFGMYTGRTPYPGSLPSKKDDENLVKTLKNITALNNDENKEYYKRLIEAGKVPAKHDINSFLQKLNISEHVPDREDAELITRFEMQGCCPDILITNYSMLEYMLLRPREHNIWDSTKDWLDSDSHNKLLFVVDEAHMYRGSSGGEVALLIRRLMHKLGINRERIQFILTTASMPRESEEDRRAVTCFANALTANDSEGEFIYLVGERDPLPDTEIKDIQLKKFLEFEAGDFEGDGDNKLLNLLKFWSDVKGFDGRISNLEEICDWMFNNLICYRPFNELIKQCRGTAVSLGELARNVFPDRPEEDALSAVSVMLSIAPLAKSKNGAILFPARMHMLFRGINGVYACVNEECPCAHTDGHLSIGEVFLSDEKMTCPYCGSVVYELYQDRRCGTLFYKGYALEKDVKNVGVTYLWHYHGQLMDKSLKEYHLYIPEEGVIVDVKAKPCYLDIKTGFIYTRDDAKEGIPGFRKLFFGDYTSKGHPDVNTFSKCPHCKHSLSSMSLTSFSTKGNQSFFNLIQTQFLLQPSVDNKGNKPDRFPNGGRKVLLFSDSRQRAAKLARDMTDMSETMVARQLFSVAISLYERSNVKQSMNDLYDYICIAAGMKHLQMFYDNDRDTFLEHSRQALRNYKKSQKRREDFEPEKNMTNAPRPIHKLLLKMFCGAYNTLPESAYCWIEPTKNALYKAVDELAENGLPVSDLEFLELFNAWMLYVCDEYVALGHIISDDIREEVRNVHHSYGIPKDWKFREFIYRRMGWKTDDNIVLIWKRVLKECFLSAKQPDNGNLYVDLSKIKPCYNPEHTWYKCEVCSELTPYMLKCGCPNCGADKIHEMTDQEYSALRFWRGPIESAINGGSIQIIDTEEHTAQLSYKDQRDELWSKTEQYELRFQDLVQNGETPVDILSSTTTMEVGIDIGSLVAVGLRNIPPMRENYQQRAGRAGRRGSSLSTIVTFCEDGPHDTLYFKNPVPMFRGDPRKPWIDIKSPKLIERHISIVVFREFFDTIGDSVDSISVPNFFDKIYDDFLMFLNRYQVNDSNLMEELEKDKYYYDNYETNYLYYDEKDDINSIKATINNYSMNKMKEINYFSYSPISINLYKNKNNNKNRISKKNTNVSSNMNKNMEIETDYNKKEIKTNKRMSKTELKNKISQMKKEYEQRKDKKNNINNTTTKTLTEEADKVYYLTDKMNFLDNKADDIKDIYDKLFLIRDLSFIFKHENYSLEKMKDKLVSNSKREKINSIKTEIKNIISDIHKKYGQRNNFPIVRFLLKYAENNSLN